MRSKCRCSMCPAIHISSRSWLRSSSTHEPSDPPPKVVSSFRFSFVTRESPSGPDPQRLCRADPRLLPPLQLRLSPTEIAVRRVTRKKKKRDGQGGPPLRGPKGSLNLRRGAPALSGTRVYPGGFGAALLLSASPAERTAGPERLLSHRGGESVGPASRRVRYPAGSVDFGRWGARRALPGSTPAQPPLRTPLFEDRGATSQFTPILVTKTTDAYRSKKSIMILPQVHLRKPCYDFYFL